MPLFVMYAGCPIPDASGVGDINLVRRVAHPSVLPKDGGHPFKQVFPDKS